jgi:hypothetical protein
MSDATDILCPRCGAVLPSINGLCATCLARGALDHDSGWLIQSTARLGHGGNEPSVEGWRIFGTLGAGGMGRVFQAESDADGTQAAIRAGYSERSAASQASDLLRIPNVARAVQAGLDLQSMDVSEILARLTRIARGSIADVLRLPPASYEEAAATLAADGVTLRGWRDDAPAGEREALVATIARRIDEVQR